MAVQYVRVNPVVDLFAPVIRGTGNLAIVGPVTPPIAAGAAPTVVATAGVGGGFPVAGSYGVAYSEVTVDGVPSPLSAAANVTLTAGQSIQVNGPALATGAVSRNFYLTTAPAGVATGLAGAATTQAAVIPTPPPSGAAAGPSLLTPNVPVAFTTAADALRQAPGALGRAIAMAFQQTPGPPLVYGVRTADGPDWAGALNVVATLDVQLVALANLPLDANSGNASTNPPGGIAQLSSHVTTVSNTGGDGQERMGIAMLAKGATGITAGGSIVSGSLANERMVYVAHKSDEDVAAAVAGTIAGYPPNTSLLLKQVNVDSGLFSPAEISAINGTETFDSGPAGQGINWLASPTLLPGHGVYMGEGYTGNPAGKKYIDIVRTVDDISFRLKAQLIRSIGNVQISRSGLRGLRVQMEAVLDPLVRSSEIDSYRIDIPILDLLDLDPSALSNSQLQQIHDAQAQRLVEVVLMVDYAGAIHRIAITLQFQ